MGVGRDVGNYCSCQIQQRDGFLDLCGSYESQLVSQVGGNLREGKRRTLGDSYSKWKIGKGQFLCLEEEAGFGCGV